MNLIDETQLGDLVVSGDAGAVTIADPSFIYPAGASVGFMSYSRVPAQGLIHSRIAVSGDHGATWADQREINLPHINVAFNSALCPPNTITCTGNVVDETSTLVADPGDVAARRWKLFTHQYLVLHVVYSDGGVRDELRYGEGGIVMYTAATPIVPWSDAGVAIAWPGSSLAGSARYLTTADAGSACLFASEPGATLAPNGELHLAFGCVTGPSAIDVVLLRSSDHGASWQYLSTPVRGRDAACFGGNQRMTAPNLFVQDGGEYLVVTPETASSRNGCVVVPMSDPDAGQPARTANGELAPTRHLLPELDGGFRYFGACTWAEGASQVGFTMSRLRLAAPAGIRELKTGVIGP